MPEVCKAFDKLEKEGELGNGWQELGQANKGWGDGRRSPRLPFVRLIGAKADLAAVGCCFCCQSELSPNVRAHWSVSSPRRLSATCPLERRLLKSPRDGGDCPAASGRWKPQRPLLCETGQVLGGAHHERERGNNLRGYPHRFWKLAIFGIFSQQLPKIRK